MMNSHNAAESSSPGCLSKEHNPSFIKPFFEDRNSDILRIPSAFTHNFNGNVPRSISLKNTSGNVWQAKLEIVDDQIYITKGWEVYVKEHSLTNAELLVFHYLQNATFLVMVFGKNGEIKKEPVFKKPGERLKGKTQPGRTPTKIKCEFVMTFNMKNFVTIPKCILKACEPKLPQEIILRNEKGRGIKTHLREIKDRVVMGYFNVSEFAELSNAREGDEIQFKVICRDGTKIKSIVMTKLSQSDDELGRGYY